MNPQVARLESLLAKIRRNAGAPRAAGAPHAAAPAPVVRASPVVEPPVVLAEEIVEVAPPVVLPAAVGPEPEGRAISGVVSVPQLTENEELLEDDIVEVASGAEAEVPASGGLEELEIDFDDEEQPPASSSRSRVPESMDEALVAAAEHMEMQEGREVPLKTPPPESGPQAAAAPMPLGIQAPHAPDVADFLDSDAPMAGGVSAAAPTPEQLGQTIDLEEARGPMLELDERQPDVAMAPAASEELEIALPQREFVGAYHEQLMPPPEARQELDAHRQRVGDEAVPPPPESLAQAPSLSAYGVSQAQPTVTTDSPSAAVSTFTVEASGAQAMPEIIARPELAALPAAKYLQGPAQRPATFLALLDSSLALIKNDG